jgi:hypothetical protein
MRLNLRESARTRPVKKRGSRTCGEDVGLAEPVDPGRDLRRLLLGTADVVQVDAPAACRGKEQRVGRSWELIAQCLPIRCKAHSGGDNRACHGGDDRACRCVRCAGGARIAITTRMLPAA